MKLPQIGKVAQLSWQLILRLSCEMQCQSNSTEFPTSRVKLWQNIKRVQFFDTQFSCLSRRYCCYGNRTAGSKRIYKLL